jgi:hypothetical protein
MIEVRRGYELAAEPRVVQDEVVESVVLVPALDLAVVLLRALQGDVPEGEVVAVAQRRVGAVVGVEDVDHVLEHRDRHAHVALDPNVLVRLVRVALRRIRVVHEDLKRGGQHALRLRHPLAVLIGLDVDVVHESGVAPVRLVSPVAAREDRVVGRASERRRDGGIVVLNARGRRREGVVAVEDEAVVDVTDAREAVGREPPRRDHLDALDDLGASEEVVPGRIEDGDSRTVAPFPPK